MSEDSWKKARTIASYITQRSRPLRPYILDRDAPASKRFKDLGQIVGLKDKELEILMDYMFKENPEKFLPMIKNEIVMAKLSIPSDRIDFSDFKRDKALAQEQYDNLYANYQAYMTRCTLTLEEYNKLVLDLIETFKTKDFSKSYTSFEYAVLKKLCRVQKVRRGQRFDCNIEDFYDLLKMANWPVLKIEIQTYELNDFVKFFDAIYHIHNKVGGDFIVEK